jgi:glycerol uptake facilitator-like aquaporin
MNDLNKYLVEFVGTLFFVYIILALKTPIAIGAALTIAILVGGKISGGNFNPVVTLVMTMSGKARNKHLLPYILAQAAGGITALELYKRKMLF